MITKYVIITCIIRLSLQNLVTTGVASISPEIQSRVVLQVPGQLAVQSPGQLTVQSLRPVVIPRPIQTQTSVTSQIPPPVRSPVISNTAVTPRGPPAISLQRLGRSDDQFVRIVNGSVQPSPSNPLNASRLRSVVPATSALTIKTSEIANPTLFSASSENINVTQQVVTSNVVTATGVKVVPSSLFSLRPQIARLVVRPVAVAGAFPARQGVPMTSIVTPQATGTLASQPPLKSGEAATSLATSSNILINSSQSVQSPSMNPLITSVAESLAYPTVNGACSDAISASAIASGAGVTISDISIASVMSQSVGQLGNPKLVPEVEQEFKVAASRSFQVTLVPSIGRKLEAATGSSTAEECVMHGLSTASQIVSSMAAITQPVSICANACLNI